MNYVSIDLGASNTRYTSNSGKICFIPNNMVFYDGEEINKNLRNEPYDASIENNLDVTITKVDGENNGYFPVRALIGSMANRIGNYQIRPSNQEFKTNQRINYISSIMACALSRLQNDGIGEEMNVFVALPPAEVKSEKDRDKLKTGLIGKYEVVFNKYGKDGETTTTVTVVIKDVATYEESRMAIMQYLFDDKHADRFKDMKDENILSLDIGASTTDLVVFSGGKFLDKSGRTFKTGCNIALEYISNECSNTLDFEPTRKEIERILVEGRIKIGTSYKDMSDLAKKAKREVANSLTVDMNNYFGRIQMPIQSFQHIIVSGGGSMESSYTDDKGNVVVTVPPMSEFITEELRRVSGDTVEVLPFGEEPRLANIRGLGKLAMMKDGNI